MYKIILSGLLILTSLIFTIISLPQYDNMRFILIMIIAIFIGGISVGFLLSAWSKGNMIKRFIDSLKISFGLASLIYIAGYIFASIQGLF